MNARRLLFDFLLLFSLGSQLGLAAEPKGRTVFIIPIREEIAPPLAYLIRRGVKDAMEANADAIILDMDTNGGRLDTTEEILRILQNFKGKTITYVNQKAFSAGAFIAIGTQEIYMAPQSVIGAAAPIMMAPGGSPQDLPDTMKAKTVSAVKALIRTSAERNGHNPAVVESMIDSHSELKMDGQTLNEKGQILTLTNLQAEKEFGNPPKPLLSLGTVSTLDTLISKLGFEGTKVTRVEATGAEKFAFWLNAISPILLIIGVVCVYIEMKTPGFGLPGTIGLTAFALYFLGGYVAGLSGLEWLAVFMVGLAFVLVEVFVFPGTMALGLIGGLFILTGLAMAMVDLYPGMPRVPQVGQIRGPLEQVLIALGASLVIIILLSRFLLKTPFFQRMASQTASGVRTPAKLEARNTLLLGQVGTTISKCRPGGKAQFGEAIMDVLTQGEFINQGRPVKVIGNSGPELIVSELANS